MKPEAQPRGRSRAFGIVLLAALALPGQAPAGAAGVVRLQRRDPDYLFRFRPEYRLAGQKGLALALRGGSGKGLAHIGVFQGLDEENLPVDGIVGTSAGSLMGSLYAAGFSAEGIARIFKSRDFGLALDDRQREPGQSLSEDEIAHAAPLQLVFRNGEPDLIPGRTTSRKVRASLLPMLERASWLSGGDFDRLRMPLRVVASDLTEGRGTVFRQGSLVGTVMASTCIPGLFEPVEIGGHQYVDGQSYENLPVRVSRREFPGLVQVGVAIGRPWDSAKKSNLGRLLEASLDLAMAQTETLSAAGADLIIRPDVNLATEFDFYYQVDSLAREGHKAFEAMRVPMEDLLYGPHAGDPAASDLVLEADGLPEAEAWLAALAPSGVLANRDLYRILRRAYRDLPVADAEVRLPAQAGGPAVLVLRPTPRITRLELDLPVDCPAEVHGQMEDRIIHHFGLGPGQRFREGAWSQVIEDLLVEGILHQAPILDVRGSGFDADGTLRLRVREPRIQRIRSQDPAQQTSLERILADLERGPVRTDLLEQRLTQVSTSLGLINLNPDLRQEDGALTLTLDPMPAPSVTLAPQFGYESSLGPYLGLDATVNNLFGSGSRFQSFGAINNLQSILQGQLLGTVGPLPRLELGIGGSLSKQWFSRQSWLPVEKLRRESFWGRAQARIGMEERGLLQVEAGEEYGNVTGRGVDVRETHANYGRMALEWDSLDAHSIPTEGALVRAKATRGFSSGTAPDYTIGYLRLRRLWKGGDRMFAPGLDLDTEWGLQQHAPQAQWFVVGGPDSFMGTPSASYLAPNFGIVRLGLPATMANLFGIAIQGVPRLDVGWLAPDCHHMGSGQHLLGGGLVLRAYVKSFHVELAGGVIRTTPAGSGNTVRDHQVSVLIGTCPYDLWKAR
jgi:predicted acylesterase/phospholipase RssA